MQYIQLIKEFFCPTVDSTMRQFANQLAKLQSIKDKSLAKSDQIGDQIDALNHKRQAAFAEANRADRVAERIANIIY